jgi:hypothetical protein
MKCPNNPDECTIEFVEEVWDNGDPSTPYYSTGFVWVYNDVDSEHVSPCTGLSQEQIEQLEQERSSEPPDYEPIILDYD